MYRLKVGPTGRNGNSVATGTPHRPDSTVDIAQPGCRRDQIIRAAGDLICPLRDFVHQGPAAAQSEESPPSLMAVLYYMSAQAYWLYQLGSAGADEETIQSHWVAARSAGNGARSGLRSFSRRSGRAAWTPETGDNHQKGHRIHST